MAVGTKDQAMILLRRFRHLILKGMTTFPPPDRRLGYVLLPLSVIKGSPCPEIVSTSRKLLLQNITRYIKFDKLYDKCYNTVRAGSIPSLAAPVSGVPPWGFVVSSAERLCR
jgi:hypothetical protein